MLEPQRDESRSPAEALNLDSADIPPTTRYYQGPTTERRSARLGDLEAPHRTSSSR